MQNTPMIQQYLDIKQQYTNELLFFRMGDFYELFFEDAQVAADILDITLTKRSNSGQEVKMAGVPYHSADSYIAKLINHGYHIAICEQIGPIPDKGLVERKVVKVITCGTIVDSNYIEDKQVSYLLCALIEQEQKNYNAAWLDLSSGSMFCQHFSNLDSLKQCIMKISPAEIITNSTTKEIFKYTYSSGQDLEHQFNLSLVPDWYCKSQNADKILQQTLSVHNIEIFEIDNQLSYACCMALLHYVKQTQNIIPKHIQSIHNIKDQNYLSLDHDTICNLELFKTIKGHKSPSLFSLLDICHTNMGSRYLKTKILQPSRAIEQINNSYLAIETLINNQDYKNNLSEVLQKLCDIERINARLALAQAKPKDLANLKLSLQLLPQLTTTLHNIPQQCCLLNVILNCLQTEKIAEINAILNNIVNEPNVWIKDGGVVAAGYSIELDNLRAIYNDTSAILEKIEQKEKSNNIISNLKIEYNKIHGFYFEITQGQLSKVPQHFIRKQTLKNCERFITVELKEFEDKFLSAKDQALELEEILFNQILLQLQNYTQVIQKIAQNLSLLDYTVALTNIAIKYHYNKPALSQDTNIEIIQGKHPVLIQGNSNFSANDCVMSHSSRRLLLITGPNMGGKSTYMRQNALIVILAYMGSFVPAQKAYIGNIDRIFTRIGASDDISSGQSTFMVEMQQAATILNQSTSKSLVLMDEIGRGTSTSDGVALAKAIAIHLATKNQALILFSTHYFELTALAQDYTTIANVHFSAIEHQNHIVFLHNIKTGPASQSYGVQVARLAGLPSTVIDNAKHYLSEYKANFIDKTQLNLFDGDKTNNTEQLLEKISLYEKKMQQYQNTLHILKHIDFNNNSPKQVFDIVFNLQKKL